MYSLTGNRKPSLSLLTTDNIRVTNIVDAIINWEQNESDEDYTPGVKPCKFVMMLEHRYTEKSLAKSGAGCLKGRDAELGQIMATVQSMYQAKTRSELDVYISKCCFYEIGNLDNGGSHPDALVSMYRTFGPKTMISKRIDAKAKARQSAMDYLQDEDEDDDEDEDEDDDEYDEKMMMREVMKNVNVDDRETIQSDENSELPCSGGEETMDFDWYNYGGESDLYGYAEYLEEERGKPDPVKNFDDLDIMNEEMLFGKKKQQQDRDQDIVAMTENIIGNKRQVPFKSLEDSSTENGFGFDLNAIKELEFHGNGGPSPGCWYSKACILFWPKSRRQMVSAQRTVVNESDY